MTVRHITIDFAGRIYEVAGLVDRFAKDTDLVEEAVACVIKLDANHWVPTETSDVPIYTVH